MINILIERGNLNIDWHREKTGQREGGHLQAKERGLQKTVPSQPHLDLRLQPPELSKCLLLKPPNLWDFVTAALAD